MKILVLRHVLNEMSAPKADTQIPSHPDHKLRFQNAHSQSTLQALAISDSHSPRAWNALPIFVHLENSYSLFKRQLRNHLLCEAFPDDLQGSAVTPPCAPVTQGRSPLYRSPYFIIANCVHISHPHCSMCLPFKGKDNVLPISHPSSTQQSVRHVVSI